MGSTSLLYVVGVDELAASAIPPNTIPINQVLMVYPVSHILREIITQGTPFERDAPLAGGLLSSHVAGKFQSWLDGGGKSPNEQVMKRRLSELL